MKKGVLIFLILVLVMGCEVAEDDKLEELCVDTMFWQAPRPYDEAVSGLSCEELNNRYTYSNWGGSCLYTSVEVDEHASNDIENILVPGVLEGTNIAINSTHRMSIQDGYLILNPKNNSSNIRYISFAHPKSVLTWKDQFLVFGLNKISIYSSKGTELWAQNFSGTLKSFLRGDEVITFEKLSELSSEEECERVHYTSDQKWQQVTKMYQIDLVSKNLNEQNEIIYGSLEPHVDKEAVYLINQVWPTSQIFKFSNLMNFSNLSGSVLNKTAIREYGEELHIVEQITSGGGARYLILDDQLRFKSDLEVVAPGESVKAAHFTDDMVYFATFLTTDPLFLVDPKNPSYLSELSYPGDPLYLHEVGDYIVSLNRLGWGSGSRLNLINKNDNRDIFITDVVSFDSDFWGFHYLDFLSYENYIFIKDSDKTSYLVKIQDENLEIVETLANTSLGYFSESHFHYLQGEQWKKIRIKGKPKLD